MNFWYHGSYTKGDHHEQDREIIRRISSFRTFRDSVLDPFETVPAGYWIAEVRQLILSSGLYSFPPLKNQVNFASSPMSKSIGLRTSMHVYIPAPPEPKSTVRVCAGVNLVCNPTLENIG